MQAIIMAAGKGSRLGELTKGGPKSFVEIRGKKLIEYNLGILRSLGVEKIVIVTGYRSDAFEALTCNMPDVILKYNPFYPLVNVLGSFYMGIDEIDDDFIYLHADTLCEKKIFTELVEFNADINLPTEFKVCDDEAMKVQIKNDSIVNISKQIPIEKAAGEFIGIASIKKEVIPILKQKAKEILAEGKFESYFEAAIQKMIEEKEYNIQCIDIKDAFWAEIDFYEDYQRAIERMPLYF